jgi:outer membrane receptor for ferrienterochelin and colicins
LLDYEHGSPASVVNVGAGYSWNRFEVDAQSRWQSQFTDYAAMAAFGGVEPVRIDDYITASARIAYRVTDEVTLALSGEQLGEPRLLTAAGTPVERRIIASISGRF